MKDTILKGKTAIITGASSGIGKATAMLFGREGATVVITGRNTESLQTIQKKICVAGGKCEYITGDVTDIHLADQLINTAINCSGHLDILVCCAGMAMRKPTLQMTMEQWDRVLSVNLSAPMFLSQKAIPYFKRQHRGKIVFVASTAAKNINLGASPSYGASKAGLVYLTRHLATEFAQDHIYVNAICPGPVDTEITKTWTPEYRQSVLKTLPMGELGKPENIANSILFLASELSDYIKGEYIMQNGGRYMGS